jgi:hypothetical protein
LYFARRIGEMSRTRCLVARLAVAAIRHFGSPA